MPKSPDDLRDVVGCTPSMEHAFRNGTYANCDVPSAYVRECDLSCCSIRQQRPGVTPGR
jgi:hypothetical protein